MRYSSMGESLETITECSSSLGENQETISEKSLPLGKNLKTTRERRGVSQTEFAEILGIPRSTLSAYENGKIVPTLEMLMNIASICDVSIDWLCGARPSGVLVRTYGDIVDFLHQFLDCDEFVIEYENRYKVFNDIEGELKTERLYTEVRVFDNDKEGKPVNATLSAAVRNSLDNFEKRRDLEYESKKPYEAEKMRLIEINNEYPLKENRGPTFLKEDEWVAEKNKLIEAGSRKVPSFGFIEGNNVKSWSTDKSVEEK